jgi:hypothetical protein
MNASKLVANALISFDAAAAFAAEPDPEVLRYKLPGDLKWNESPTYPPESTKPMPAGSVIVHYGGKIHYDGAKSEPCEIILYGIGPATTTRVGGP